MKPLISDLPDKILRSPLTFPVFLIIPLAVVILRASGRIAHTLDLLLVNNALLLAYLGARLYLYLSKFSENIRYGTGSLFPRKSVNVDLDSAAVRERLEREGFSFNAAGAYGERRDRGYLGTVLVHAGLLLLLLFGLYDNLRQLDGTILLGVGEPLKLYEKGSYGVLVNGLLASPADAEMKLQIKRQILPSAEWPAGATEVVLLSKDDRELQRGIIAPGRPMRQGTFDIYMNRFLYDAWVVVTTKNNLIIFTNFVKLLPMKEKQGAYTHYGDFRDESLKVKGAVWIDPEKKAIKVETSREGKRIVDTELILWGGNRKEQGDYVARFEGLGQWSELHVTRHRHRGMLVAGLFIVAAGLALRVLYRPMRVWIESEGDATLVRTTSRGVLDMIRGLK